MTSRKFAKILLPLALLLCCFVSAHADSISYIPQVHGIVRARGEMRTSDAAVLFQVRNARLDVSGHIGAPVRYMINADFCNRGSFTMLDAYVELQAAKGLKVTAGQMLAPFSQAQMRPTKKLIFADRCLLAAIFSTTRAVGAKVAYTLPFAPITFQGGPYNTATLTRQSTWQRKLSYIGRASWAKGPLQAGVGFESLCPDSVRINGVAADAQYKPGGWTLQAEYAMRHYTHHSFSTCHAWAAAASFAFPIKAGVFNQASAQCRYDGITDYSDGSRDASGKLTLTSPRCQRMTIGGTLTYQHKVATCLLRLNYEQYFYPSGVVRHDSRCSKLVAEVAVIF